MSGTYERAQTDLLHAIGELENVLRRAKDVVQVWAPVDGVAVTRGLTRVLTAEAEYEAVRLVRAGEAEAERIAGRRAGP